MVELLLISAYFFSCDTKVYQDVRSTTRKNDYRLRLDKDLIENGGVLSYGRERSVCVVGGVYDKCVLGL